MIAIEQLELIPRERDALSEAIDLAAEAIDLLQAQGIEAPDLYARWEAFDPLEARASAEAPVPEQDNA